jgi:hypothetical protein
LSAAYEQYDYSFDSPGPQLVPAVRLLKAWNSTYGQLLKSHSIERLVAEAFPKPGTTLTETVYEFLRSVEAGHDDVVTGLSRRKQKRLQAAAKTARFSLDRAFRAEMEGRRRSARRHWTTVFGRYGAVPIDKAGDLPPALTLPLAPEEPGSLIVSRAARSTWIPYE